MLKHALKEWASVCHALAQGHQILVLRKGGIAEPTGALSVESQKFWLYPTYVHQKRDALKADCQSPFDQIEKDKPPKDLVRLQHFAELIHTQFLTEVEQALALSDYHSFTEETVRSRFDYRRPGLHVFVLRVYQLPETIEIVETPEYAGCKSWVDLDTPLTTTHAQPVLSDHAFERQWSPVQEVLANSPHR